jgi:GT2 family glycosyltransferase
MTEYTDKIVEKTCSHLASFIVVNWNGQHLLEECIDSILNQNCQLFEIIVVDNASSDQSVQFVRTRYPKVKIIALKENTGFTGGNIAGLREAVGDFIVLLNNDAVIAEKWLEVMLTELLSDSNVGFCSSKIIIAGTDKVDSVGDTITSAFSGTKLGEYEPESNFNERRLVQGACAAAVIYKREMLNQIGFLDEDFFFNHEDTDLNLRAWLSGWKCMFVPEAVVHHKVSASVGELSDKGVYYFSRNNVWVWIKNTPPGFLFRNIPQRIIYELCSFAFFCIKKGKWGPFLKGKKDALKKIPIMLKKRKDIQRLVRLTRIEIESGLMPITKYIMLRLQNIK